MGKARQKNIMAFFGPPSGASASAKRATPTADAAATSAVRGGGEAMRRASTGVTPRPVGGGGVDDEVELETPATATGMGMGGEMSQESPAVTPIEGGGAKRMLFGGRGTGDDFEGRARKVRKVIIEDDEEDDGECEVVDVKMEPVATQGGRVDFGSQFVHGSAPQKGLAKARRVLDVLDLSGSHKEGEGGWCDKNKWSVDVRDASKRRLGEEGYDPSTLFIPRRELDGMSPFQRQFWDLKSRYYDTMLLVKKGAFYEAYDVDADIVHKELGLNYTGGGRASMRCAGVPESTLNKHAARLIDMGYRVGIVVQTESGNTVEKRKSAGGKASKAASICHRELVRILTKATVTDDDLLRDHRARYVLAIREAEAGSVNSLGEILVGVCHVDAASGQITFGEFLDDSRRSWTEKLITTLQPPELIVPVKGTMTERMRSLVRWTETGASSVDVQYRDDEGFPAMSNDWLAGYGDGGNMEESATMLESGIPAGYFDAHPLGARAFGAVASYLQQLMIDKEIMSLGNFSVLPEPSVDSEPKDGDVALSGELAAPAGQARQPGIVAPAESGTDGYDPSRSLGSGLAMDAATMANLEVLANVVDGSERGALISVIDCAATPAGRRLLRRWISDPLALSAAIEDRLNAVDVLMDAGDDTRSFVRKALHSGVDLERALPRLHQFAVVADGAVTYDQTNGRRVKAFVKVLRGLQKTIDGLDRLAEDVPENCNARRLKWLLTPGSGYAKNARKELDFFLTASFDVSIAEKEGELVPQEGGSSNYDAARAALDAVDADLDAELEYWRKELKDKTVKYYSRGKETFQLEIKAATLKRAGRAPELLSTSESKTAKRFHTKRIREFLRVHVDAAESFADASMNLLREIITRFDEHRETWTAVVRVSAEVDALIGLSIASQGDGTGPMARPEILPNSHPEPVLESVDLRHPVLAAKAGASFVANSAHLGGGRETIALVTGSNCSGKSTFSRQVAVAVILAQIGAYVPAKRLRLRPVDSIFARAGSRDEIARGRSTFMVEMEEAALIVNTASQRSLVIVDELCSGTTAQDAHAISHATLDKLLEIKCLTVFCTHADSLAFEFSGRVANFTMAADVDEEKKTILFLYKLVSGVTSESRGVFCARVAGVPSKVADEAEQVAANFDRALTAKRKLRAFMKIASVGSLNNSVSFAEGAALLKSSRLLS